MGKLLSDRDAHRIQQMLRQFERGGGGQIYRRNPRLLTAGAELRIFEAQEAATGDGVYKCFQQSLNTDNWDDVAGADKFTDTNETEIEVLNLLENDPIHSATAALDYQRALGLYDRIAARQLSAKWVGIPLSSAIRQVKATEDAPDALPSASGVTCNLLLNNGVEAAVDELGYHIEVFARISGGVKYNECLPRIVSGDWMTAYNEQGKWWFTDTFEASLECD